MPYIIRGMSTEIVMKAPIADLMIIYNKIFKLFELNVGLE